MVVERNDDHRFGSIAVALNIVDPVQMDRALVVQSRIFEKTRVSMPIGEILVEMGVISPHERDELLQMQRERKSRSASDATPAASGKKGKRLTSGDNVESTLDIRVSRDKLSASAFIDGEIPVKTFNVSDVKIMLHSENILHGIVDDEQIEAFLQGKFGERWTIATGTQPIPDSPPQINYFFDTDPLIIGTLTETGLMDWKDRGQLPQVKEGDLLAEKIPGAKGKEGMDVYGKKIPIPKMREHRFKCAKGARRSENGLQVFATRSGIPKRSATGDISVMSTLHIQGDISLETGHVEFDGHIEVAGTVEKDYRVKGGSLRASEIRGAQIDIEGDIIAINGIFGATIRCGGNLKAGHIHNADIGIAGDLCVEKEIIESAIESNGRCLINDGVIISSSVSAKMGIAAMDIGTEASKSSEVSVGIDRQLEREIDAIKAKIQAIQVEHESLPNLLQRLGQRSDQINTRLGEVAQDQDKCMVQHRRLQEKIEAGLLKQGGAAAEKLKHTTSELKAQQDAYDQDVARLMEEDETISREIAATQLAITESAKTIQEYNARLDSLTEAQKTDRGLAVVKIGGTLFSGTKISGPHSALVIQEDLKRLSIVETDKPDHAGVRRWRFELSSFR